MYNLDGEWPTLQMYPSLSEALDEEITPQTPTEHLLADCRPAGFEVSARDRGYGHGKLVELGGARRRWDTLVGARIHPFPGRDNALTRQHRSIAESPRSGISTYAARTGDRLLQLVIPVVQRSAFAQAAAAAAGDDEAMQLDDDFLAAMECGIRATGTGMGIDHCVMALTGLSIRETVAFSDS